ncbi:MAG: hypothetical protein ACXVC7_09670, partial [Bacteroidia bacterium]
MKRFLLLSIVFLISAGFYYEDPKPPVKKIPPFIVDQNRWVDSVFNSLTPDQRLAQLFMVAAYSNKDMKHVKEIKELITNY